MMLNNMSELMKQAKEMQEKLKEAQKEVSSLEVTGQSGGGMVRVTLSGEHDVQNVVLDPELFEEDKKVMEDLIAAAFNDAVQKLEREKNDKMAELAGKHGLPSGVKMPF